MGGRLHRGHGRSRAGIFCGRGSPRSSATRLREIGTWLKANGASIHGTTASPFRQAFAWGRVTAKGENLYLHVFERPADGLIRLPVSKPFQARLLATGTPLVLRQEPSGTQLLIELPAQLPDTTDTVVELAPAAPGGAPAAPGEG